MESGTFSASPGPNRNSLDGILNHFSGVICSPAGMSFSGSCTRRNGTYPSDFWMYWPLVTDH